MPRIEHQAVKRYRLSFIPEIYFLSFSNLLKFQQHEKDDLLYNDRLPPVRDRM